MLNKWENGLLSGKGSDDENKDHRTDYSTTTGAFCR
jgi:hypothetical protein